MSNENETVTETTATETATTETTATETVKGPGVGEVAKQLILEGKTNEEVLAAVKAQFPDAKTSAASINWYRNKMRSDGVEGVKTSREIKAANKPAKEPKEKKPRGRKAKAKAEAAAPAAEADILA